ncbi:hypothetical protein LTS18_005731 [Coniosporium uncinatum]|uniref:Uncharacterized protein n=2 Tax=Coniosporium uncinatum TaxID=93489 RepID=A0ACC3D4N8_9PEZI|nr:hypothetical protein LTS18_005369 [Coniosporium uncinatum]KAK3079105.1 hypothetical protein LTS18_005731 [Coniosporium uncinatum]
MAPNSSSVLYPSSTPSGDATDFNMDYYLSTHMPLVQKTWGPHGLEGYAVTQFKSTGDGGKPPYLVQCVLKWGGDDCVGKAMGAEGTGEV